MSNELSQALIDCIFKLDKIKTQVDRGNKDQHVQIEAVKNDLHSIQLEMVTSK